MSMLADLKTTVVLHAQEHGLSKLEAAKLLRDITDSLQWSSFTVDWNEPDWEAKEINLAKEYLYGTG